MKNSKLNNSATKNTLADMAVTMLANGDVITPESIVPETPEIDVAKIYDNLKKSERNADTKEAGKNTQSNNGEKKSSSTRAKLKNTVNVSEMMNKPASREDNAPTIGELMAEIKETHEQLQSGQIEQIAGFAKQGRALVLIKKNILTQKQLKESDEKQVSRIFGAKLKEAGIGDDVIARQARSMYIWLAENEKQAQEFLDTSIATEKSKRTKEQKRVANAHARVGLTPYVLFAAMSDNEPKPERTAMDTAKAHIKQVMKESKLESDSADYDAQILELAKSLLESALAELNV